MARIESTKRWNDTDIDLIENHHYKYTATGKWKDKDRICDADGYSDPNLDTFSFLKRRRSAQWFQLIGAVDKKTKYTIDLGTNGNFTAPASGRLWVYANDANWFYFNNDGSIELHIH
jgi:hypothetical protein